jgi:hypothetical protein
MAGILTQLGVPSLNTLNSGAGNTSATTPATNFSASPTSTALPNGVKASNPIQKVSPPSNTLSSTYQAPQQMSEASIQSASAANPSSFNFLPGESAQAYNSRIAALTSGQGAGQTGGAGGGQIGAPQGNYTAATVPAANQSTTPPAPVAPSTPTNAGFLGQLMGNTGNPQFSADNTNLQNLKNQQADLEASIAGGDQPLYFKQGEMGQEQQAYQTKLAAAGQAVQNDIGEQNAQTTAASAGATATLPGAQNVQVPYNNQYLNGTTGQPVNPQAAQDMQSAVALEIQKVQNNQEDLATAQGNLSAYGQAGLNALNQGLGPNFNANTNAGASSAQASNAQVGGTAAVNAGNAAYQSANPAYLKLANYTIPNIEGFGQLLTSGAGGINPFASQYANMTLQQFQNQLSSPQQAQFQTTFQQLKQSIADLAASGGSQTPTANSAQAEATLSPTSSLATIQQTLQRISQEGQQYLTSQAALNNAALSQAQGGGTSGGSSGSSGATPNPWH